MDYTEILLEAFATDLMHKKNLGASDVSFDGGTEQVQIRGQGQKGMFLNGDVPTALLQHIVRSIFGDSRCGSLTWRGFRMSTQTKQKGEKLVDVLVVRLTVPQAVVEALDVAVM